MPEHLLIGLTLILVLGIAARWIAWRLHLPSILLLLLSGILIGPVSGFLHPDEVFGDLLLPLVSLSVAVILFEGGLSLSLADLREIGSIVRNLVTMGVLVTWVITTAAAYFILGFAFSLALLLGAILVVTGPTVVIPLLRHVRPKRQIGNIVKWEGILNDPVGALLAVLVYEAILAGGFHGGPRAIVEQFFTSVAVGCAVGFVGAALMVVLLRYYWIPDFLHNGFSPMMVVGVFTVSNIWEAESGLLAVTVMGIALANQKFCAVKHIVEFKENLRVLMISSVFIILSARLDFSALADVSLRGLAFLAVLMLVARPAAVSISTMGSGLSSEEKKFLAWMAPRGIVAAAISSIFSARLIEAGVAQAEELLPVTFLVIIGTVTVYGLGAFPVARRLGVAQPDPQGALIVGAHSWARAIGQALRREGIRVVLVDSNRPHVAAANLAGLSARYGAILSEKVLDEIELYGINRLLAVTSNDDANSLAALHFAEIFGRAEVYQLSPGNSDSAGRKSTSPEHLAGRFLFGDAVTHEHLSQMFEAGASVKTTRITEKFDYAAFREMYGDSAVPMFIKSEGGELSVVTAESSARPRAGQTLFSLVRADADGSGLEGRGVVEVAGE